MAKKQKSKSTAKSSSRSRGRPKHTPTEHSRGRVKLCKAAGQTNEQIAQVLGVARNTLEKYYPEELANGKAEVDAMVVGQLVKQIREGNVASTIFYCKTRLGWREKSSLEVSGPEGAPLGGVNRPKDLSMEEWLTKFGGSKDET